MCIYKIKNKKVLLCGFGMLIGFLPTAFPMKPIKGLTNKSLPQLLGKINHQQAPMDNPGRDVDEITPLFSVDGDFFLINKLKDLGVIIENVDERGGGDGFACLAMRRSLADFLEIDCRVLKMMDVKGLGRHLNKYIDYCQWVLDFFKQEKTSGEGYSQQFFTSCIYIKSIKSCFKCFQPDWPEEFEKKYKKLLNTYRDITDRSKKQ